MSIPTYSGLGIEFECQQCGVVIDWWPEDDCENCGGGHWLSPPKGIATSRTAREK